MLDATNEWYFNMNEGHLTSVVFLDLAKAFDSVDHSILLQKLQLFGIPERSLGWFFSYLDNRQQKCCIDGKVYQILVRSNAESRRVLYLDPYCF